MFCRQIFSIVRGYSSFGAVKPLIGSRATPLSVSTPTTRTPPKEFANDETIVGILRRTFSSKSLASAAPLRFASSMN